LKNGKNLFWDPKGEEKISKFAWQFNGPDTRSGSPGSEW
jgi:hypothetical protein